MIKMKNMSALAAAASLAIAPAALQAADSPLSRTTAPVEGESELGGGAAVGVILLLGAIGMGALLIAEDDDNDAVSA